MLTMRFSQGHPGAERGRLFGKTIVKDLRGLRGLPYKPDLLRKSLFWNIHCPRLTRLMSPGL